MCSVSTAHLGWAERRNHAQSERRNLPRVRPDPDVGMESTGGLLQHHRVRGPTNKFTRMRRVFLLQGTLERAAHELPTVATGRTCAGAPYAVAPQNKIWSL